MQKKGKNTKGKKTQNKFLQLIPLFVAALLIVLIIVLFLRVVPTSEHMDTGLYFGFSEEIQEPSFGEEGEKVAAVVVGDHEASERALIVNGKAYIDYTLVRRELNSRFYWDSSEGLVLFTTQNQVFEIGMDTTVYTVNGEEFDAGYTILKTTPSELFLAVDFLELYSDLHCDIFEDPDRIVITFGSEQILTAAVKKDSVLRYRGGIKSPILTEIAAGDEVRVLETLENWSEVVTDDGYIGYIRNKRISDPEEELSETWYNAEYSSIQLDDRVRLAWHQIDYAQMNETLSEELSGLEGVNVISPTWYFLNDNEGNMQSFADETYVKTAHKKGLQVWPLVSNFSNEVSTSAILSMRWVRQKIENYLIDQALSLGFDGINIDFEGIAEEAGYDYVQFLRELSILCRENGIILSVDVPVPYEFNSYYDRKELGTVCDYVIVMGYDEHYAGSDAGSIASITFEEDSIRNSLKEVPEEKLISGIPFYSRIWYTEETGDGTGNITSEIVTMKETQQILTDQEVRSSYDEDSGQQYAEWTAEDGTICQIWIEDKDSVAARAALVKEYELGGIAAWRIGYEDEGVWDIITESLE